MLKFNSEQGVLNFLTALDTTIQNWDSDSDLELEGLPSEKLLGGDPTKNAFDSAMGFSSLRKKYEMDYYDNPDFKTNLLINIDEEDLRTILNQNHEVQIGTTVYKFLGKNIVAKIYNEDYLTLLYLRNNPGSVNNSANLSLNNATTGELLQKTTSDIINGCVITVYYQIDLNVGNDYRQIKLTMLPVTENSGTPNACGYFYYVKWGDGFETSPINPAPVLQHTYNVTLGPGGCRSYNISIRVTSYGCSPSACNNTIGVANPTVNICVPLDGCGKNTDYKESAPTFFMFGGIEYRIIGGVGSQHNTAIIPRRNMIYSRTFWQKKYSNGLWYPTKNKKAYLTARVYGPVFKNSCTTQSDRDKATTKRNQVHVTLNDGIGEQFGYTRIDPNTLKSDHHVFIDIGGGYTASIFGHKLQ